MANDVFNKPMGVNAPAEIRVKLTADARINASDAVDELNDLLEGPQGIIACYDIAHTCWFMYDPDEETWVYQFAMVGV